MKLSAEEVGRRSEPGQGHAAVGHKKKLPRLVARRAEVRRLLEEFRTSERRVCGLMGLPRTTYQYQSCRDDSELRERLLELARERPRFGYRRLHILLRREAIKVNHKKVQRVYRELGLTVKRTRRKRLERLLQPRPMLTAPNHEWSIDFASDVTAGSQRIRVLSVIDSFTKQSLALEVDTSFPSRRMTRVLEKAIGGYGKPPAIRCDNGPELTSRHFLAWAIEKKIDILHIRPGKPTENAYVESFHGRLRDECLNVSWFWNLFDARRKISAWQLDYNSQRPHSSLGYRTPAEFHQAWLEQTAKQTLLTRENQAQFTLSFQTPSWTANGVRSLPWPPAMVPHSLETTS